MHKPTSKTLLFLFCIIAISLILFFRLNQSRYLSNFNKSTVIHQMQSLNKYETASFTIEKIIEVGTQGNRFQQLLYGDRILLIAYGQVIAGFDLSLLKESDIEVSPDQLTVTLPPPQIFTTKLDSAKTKVYDRQQGLLTQGDKDLESEARQIAEQQITQAACDGGILHHASTNAHEQLSTIFKTLGFQAITINIPQGTC